MEFSIIQLVKLYQLLLEIYSKWLQLISIRFLLKEHQLTQIQSQKNNYDLITHQLQSQKQQHSIFIKIQLENPHLMHKIKQDIMRNLQKELCKQCKHFKKQIQEMIDLKLQAFVNNFSFGMKESTQSMFNQLKDQIYQKFDNVIDKRIYEEDDIRRDMEDIREDLKDSLYRETLQRKNCYQQLQERIKLMEIQIRNLYQTLSSKKIIRSTIKRKKITKAKKQPRNKDYQNDIVIKSYEQMNLQ